MEDLDNVIKGKLLSDKKISKESLIPWQSAILVKVDKKFSKLKTRIKSFKINPSLKKFDIISCLEAPKKQFVFVSIDKASNNIAIICKRYYAEMILNQIGVLDMEITLIAKLIISMMR